MKHVLALALASLIAFNPDSYGTALDNIRSVTTRALPDSASCDDAASGIDGYGGWY